MKDIDLALDFLFSQSTYGLVQLFWFTLVLEIPRYLCGVLSFTIAALARPADENAAVSLHRTVSVIVVGHNERGVLERCLLSLREQSRPPDEVIVVSDGSADGMALFARALQQRGLANHVLATDLRGGKSSGFNLALRACRGDIVVNVDCDCSYDRFALERIVDRFTDPNIGAVAGDIVPRNSGSSLVAQFQTIEYLISISVGRLIAFGLNQVSCIPGAFGAFRRVAVEQVGGCDAGGGEDLDLTLRLRQAGWRVGFAADAACYTDVPDNLWPLIRQRLRWERDALRLRCRKHRRTLLGSGTSAALHQWDFLIFELAATIVFPLYLAWLVARYGAMAVPILLSMQISLAMLDTAVVSLAALFVPRPIPIAMLLFVPGYTVFAGWIMRPVRLIAYVQEWLLFGSRFDNYVPAKVRLIRKW